MSNTILDYITPNARGRTLGPPRRCANRRCRRSFRTVRDRRTQLYCSRSCWNQVRYHQTVFERQCPECGKAFLTRVPNHRLCSVACRRARKNRRRRGAPGPSQGSVVGTTPVCPLHPEMRLSFGSDPLTGRSLEFCGECGKVRLLPIRGVHTYPQRTELDSELDRKVANAQRRPGNAIRPSNHKKGDRRLDDVA